MVDLGRLAAARLVKPLHSRLVAGGRLRRISEALLPILPADARCGLDVGAGDGAMLAQLESLRPGLEMRGVDVLIRPGSDRVESFDGKSLPFPDRHFDFCLLVDVLHHVEKPRELLEECVRVSRNCLLIKDHFAESAWDRTRLRFMDWVGNRAYGVNLTYRYDSRAEWRQCCESLGLKWEACEENFRLYPGIFQKVFGDGLHFAARLALTRR